ncbi:MAG: OmpA family protein, partial [Elusimicrobiota bacterium]
LGIGIYSVQETLDTNYSASAILGDLGLLYRSANGVFSFGAAVQNAGSEIKYTGMTQGEKPPQTQRAGIAFRFNLPEHYSDVNISIDYSKTDAGLPVYSIGFEHVGAKVLSLRAGYRYVTDSKQTKETGSSSLRLGLGLMIKGVGIDYAFAPMGYVGDYHRVTFMVKFGGRAIKEVPCALKVDPEIFSPNGDGIKDGTFFLPEVAQMEKTKSWEVSITDASDKVIKKLGATEEAIPKIITWDGKDEMGKYIIEGKYSVEFRADSPDKIAKSKKALLTADMTQPEVTLTASATTFSPGVEGLVQDVTFYFEIKDSNGIDRWQVTVYSPKNTAVKKFKSDEYVSVGSATVSERLIWNGRDEVNDWIVPNGEYNVTLGAYDTAGNKKTDAVMVAVYVPPKVEVKELPPEGLKVSLSSEVLFAPGKADLKKTAYPRLDKIIELLNAYPSNNVVIEGHTDTAENRERAIELSTERAWKVYSYLVEKGVNKERLSAKGYGFEKPIASNKTKKGR